MTEKALHLEDVPRLQGGCMLVAMSGWMNGGEVSTGTAEWLIDQLDADVVGSIDPEPFYLYNFPGSMEIAAMFRPHVRIEEGLIEQWEGHETQIFAAPAERLAILVAREPNMRWRQWCDCVLQAAQQMEVGRLYFIGSVGGLVPHTRDPRFRYSVAATAMSQKMRQLNLEPGGYEGPASTSTMLTRQAAAAGLDAANIVAEIPAYIEGHNPKCIEAVVRKITQMLGITMDLEPLRELADEWEKKLDEAVAEKDELAEHIEKLEENYDHQVFDTQMGDLKQWLVQRGIRVD